MVLAGNRDGALEIEIWYAIFQCIQ